ncbi:MAG: hypothetical protein ACOZNI_05425 [Myxococcota bacterium]
MAAAYLDWLADVFEEAQVPLNEESAPWLDASMRKLVNGEGASDEEMLRRLRERWLKHGQPGRQLLAAFIRDEAFARRDSPLRPREGGAYYTNSYVQKTTPPHVKPGPDNR